MTGNHVAFLIRPQKRLSVLRIFKLRAQDEEGDFDVLGLEDVQQFVGVRGSWSVVKGNSVLTRLSTIFDNHVGGASPAVSGAV